MDAFVGNPPFMGVAMIITGDLGDGYVPTGCKQLHEGAHGNADLCAHFFRRAVAARRARHHRSDRDQHDCAGRHASNGLQHLVEGGLRHLRRHPLACRGPARQRSRSSVVHLEKGIAVDALAPAPPSTASMVAAINSRLRRAPSAEIPAARANAETGLQWQLRSRDGLRAVARRARACRQENCARTRSESSRTSAARKSTPARRRASIATSSTSARCHLKRPSVGPTYSNRRGEGEAGAGQVTTREASEEVLVALRRYTPALYDALARPIALPGDRARVEHCVVFVSTS